MEDKKIQNFFLEYKLSFIIVINNNFLLYLFSKVYNLNIMKIF